MGKLIIFFSSFRLRKSTIINYLLTQNLNLSILLFCHQSSAAWTEQHGVEYFFLSPDEFRYSYS